MVRWHGECRSLWRRGWRLLVRWHGERRRRRESRWAWWRRWIWEEGGLCRRVGRHGRLRIAARRPNAQGARDPHFSSAANIDIRCRVLARADLHVRIRALDHHLARTRREEAGLPLRWLVPRARSASPVHGQIVVSAGAGRILRARRSRHWCGSPARGIGSWRVGRWRLRWREGHRRHRRRIGRIGRQVWKWWHRR